MGIVVKICLKNKKSKYFIF